MKRKVYDVDLCLLCVKFGYAAAKKGLTIKKTIQEFSKVYEKKGRA